MRTSSRRQCPSSCYLVETILFFLITMMTSTRIGTQSGGYLRAMASSFLSRPVPSRMTRHSVCGTSRWLIGGAIQSNNGNDPRTSSVEWPTSVPFDLHRAIHRNSLTAVAITNEEIVQRHLKAAREKRQAREQSAQQRTLRNLQLKRLVSTECREDENVDNNIHDDSDDGLLYALRVTVSPELRALMKNRLSAREKRGRVFVQGSSEASRSMRGLKQELHQYFSAVLKDTYVLQASYPTLVETASGKNGNGTVLSAVYPNSEATNASLTSNNSCGSIETDEDVVDLLSKARTFYREHKDLLKRPTMILNVNLNPLAPPPAPAPAYLEGMPDPNLSSTLTMLSFYAFPPGGIENPDEFALTLRKRFRPFQALGRVYVAAEGVNAQMSVPTNVVPNFVQCCGTIPNFGEHIENGVNIDPVPLPRSDNASSEHTSSDLNNSKSSTAVAIAESSIAAPPFKNLHIRVRRQIVADGLNKSYDWQSAGYDMPALEWHDRLSRAKARRERQRLLLNPGSLRGSPSDCEVSVSDSENPIPIVLDCRNKYETDIGTFEGAEALNTVNFRDSWKVLEDRLKDVPKDYPIMGFCTGGIRCVKVGAYLTQELGFTNFSRLASGIIGYDRALKENKVDDSMFVGTNFVFDGRLGRPITEDSLGTCFTCGAETSSICNCRNNNCHKRIIQCEQCKTAFQGTCSEACRQRLLNGAMTPKRRPLNGEDVSTMPPLGKKVDRESPCMTLDDYSTAFSSPLPSVYSELILNTKALIPSGSHMLSGGVQGRLLTQLASMTREGRVLEIGTFSGYGTACLLEGTINLAGTAGGKLGSRIEGPYVMTMERDVKAFQVAVNHLRVLSSQGFTEASAKELSHLRYPESAITLSPRESLVSLNCVDVSRCELVLVSDALAAVEQMAAGQGELVPGPFDLVFLDADKTRLLEYVDVFLSSDLLKRGGIIVVDNVLYKGLVLEASRGEFVSLQDGDDATDSELRRNRRQRRLAKMMHRFNEAVVQDVRAEVIVLPLRDGLTVIRKK